MFIRQTTTSNSATGKAYITYRLVASERVGKQVRQCTKLNLGRHFALPKADWPLLCRRLETLLSGQPELCPEPVSATIEALAQRYYAQLVVKTPASTPEADSDNSVKPDSCKQSPAPEFQEVDVTSLELIRPRSVGVEHAGLMALNRLGLPEILADAGLNGIQCSCALGSIIGRLAAPGSELATWGWLREQSALGELLDVDFEGVALNQLYKVSDLLIRHQEQIEQQLFARISDLFHLTTTVTLYDLTNTYFEGEQASNAKAARGHSKEKRSDCVLVTLGLVLDGSGFVRRSRAFAGNVGEAATLEGMLEVLNAPKNATVIMDLGIATEDNVAWLVAHGYRYLVVSRERDRQFDEEHPVVEAITASEEVVRLQRVLSPDGAEVRLYCSSEKRAEKERAMVERFTAQFEQGLTALAAGLSKPRCEKRTEKLWERIGRLKERSHGMGQHYTITLTPDESGAKAVALTWEKTPVVGTLVTHPGVYGHLFITVLAYQAIQAMRRQLKEQGITTSWTGLRDILSVQRRVTATFQQRDGRTLHIRKATVAEPKLLKIYEGLGISTAPGGVKKMVC